MATRFPKFSQVLSEDPTTRRIWYSIEQHMTLKVMMMLLKNFISKDFRFSFWSPCNYFLWTAGNLFHVAGNFEQWILNPLKVKPIAHGIWDPHFGETALKAFTRGGVIYPVNIALSGLSMVVHNWYENESRFICCFGFLINCFVSFITSWLVTSSTTI
jgi:photosystem I P700 chlorophyll a apoprotein A2